MTDLTGPEHHVARQQAKDTVRGNKCRFCFHRESVFEHVICSGHAGRTFRECTTDGLAPTFFIDPNFAGVA